MGAIEVRFGGEIDAYIAGKCYDMQLVAIELDQQRVRLHDPNN
jgi:hypothetical protein